MYACDVGLLGALADLPADSPSDDLSILTGYQGAFVENYVAQHLVALNGATICIIGATSGREAEVDFLLQQPGGASRWR